MSIRSKILQNQFFIPFGRFRIFRKRADETSGVFVGRESQRAFLVDALSGIGERGAFLITGRRGVGKTTFVESCLEEYHQNAFRRFLGSGAGRSVFDILLLFGFTIAILVVGLAASELLEFLVVASEKNPLLYAPMLICLVVILFPIYLAASSLKQMYAVTLGRMPIVFAGVTLFLLCYAMLFLAPFGAPAQSLSGLFLGLAMTVFAANAFAFSTKPLMHRKNRSKKDVLWLHFMRNVMLPAGLLIASLLLVMGLPADICKGASAANSYSVGFWAWLVECKSDFVPDYRNAQNNLLLINSISVSLVLSTFLANAIVMLVLSRIVDKTIPNFKEWSIPLRNSMFAIAAFFIFHLYTAAFSFGNLRIFGASLAVLFAAVAFQAAVRIYYSTSENYTKLRRDSGLIERDKALQTERAFQYFVPPVESLLLFKSVVLLTVSLQLLYPIYGLTIDQDKMIAEERSLAHEKQSAGQNSCETERIGMQWNATLLQPWYERQHMAAHFPQDNMALECQNIINPLHFTLFKSDSEESAAWFIVFFLILTAVFLMEYEWINRPFDQQRRPRALDRGPRHPFQVHHHLDPMWFESWMANAGVEVESATPKEDAWSRFDQRNWLQRTSLNRFRQLEAVTISQVLVRLWLPVLIVRVNLGFDSLDHRGVTHAMLYGLRREFKRAFVSFTSPYALISNFTFNIVLLMSVVFVSRALIDVPYAGPAKVRTGDFRFENSSDFDACIWLSEIEARDIETKGSSVIPKAICALPDNFGEGVLRVLFAEVFRFSIDSNMSPDSAFYRDGEVSTSNKRRLMVHYFVHYNHGLPTFQEFTKKTGDIEAGLYLVQIGTHSVRVYHLLLGLLLYRLLRMFTNRFSLLPYRRNLRQIEELINNLTKSSLERSDRSNNAGLSFTNFSFGRKSSNSNEMARDPVDPRSVELALLSLLQDIRQSREGKSRLSFGHLTIPRPDIHFIFDELDKVGGIVGSEYSTHGIGDQEKAVVDAERQRTYQLHSLLSDMKRVISSAPARFLFVGGRILHDEWIRDQNRIGSRQPLLTSIFDHEIYLPSLLLDFPRSRFENTITSFQPIQGTEVQNAQNKSLDFRVRELLVRYYLSSKSLDTELQNNQFLPFFSLADMSAHALKFEDSEIRKYPSLIDLDIIDGRVANFFVARRLDKQNEISELLAETRRDIRAEMGFALKPRAFKTVKELVEHSSKFSPAIQKKINDLSRKEKALAELMENDAQFQEHWRNEFFEVLCGFLAYRSAGSPKKLHELLSSMVRPSGSFASPALSNRHYLLKSRDVLLVDSNDLYRMQFIDSVFRHIEQSFGADLLRRDDKITINTFFILDFLMKMHNRAFDWSSIERLDELAHIHRAPDLRRLFDAVVSNSAERFFHRVLNGLYAFRFRSDLAIEIRYLSRVSEHEMAALNFTLDESQELKTTYTNMIASAGEPNPDLYTALGELYEYDQAYDIARGYYEQALRLLDAEFARSTGAMLEADDPASSIGPLPQGAQVVTVPPAVDPVPFMRAILTGEQSGKAALKTVLPWAIQRLRIVMQIGLTYEQPGDEERAQAQYHAAHMFSRALLEAALPLDADGKTVPSTSPFLPQVLKHLSLVFQPVFASAWIAEKIESGVDTSLSIVSQEMRDLRKRLPFVNDSVATQSEDLKNYLGETTKQRDAGSNHALVMAELNNKAGDLYFFKGRATYPVGGSQFRDALLGEVERSFDSNADWARHGDSFEGYLMRAHFHYALALHEVRRYTFYRHHMSHARINVVPSLSKQDREKRWNTLDARNLPTFVLQTAYSSLVDLAEVTLSRSSLMAAWLEMSRVDADLNADFFKDLTQLPFAKANFKNLSKPDNQSGEGTQGFAEQSYHLFRKSLDRWFLRSDEDLEKGHSGSAGGAHASDSMEALITEFFGLWKGEPGEVNSIIGFSKLSTNSHRILVGLLTAFGGARFCNRANYPDTASFEHQIVSEHILRFLKNARSILLSNQFPDAPNSGPQEPDFGLTQTHIRFLSVLIEFGCMAVNRHMRLYQFAYPNENKSEAAFEQAHTQGASATSGAGPETELKSSKRRKGFAVNLATICELRLIVSSLKGEINRRPGNTGDHTKIMDNWDDAMEFLDSNARKLLGNSFSDVLADYQLNFSLAYKDTHRREARAQLIYLVTHHKYPVLGNLRALKALIDDTLIEDGVLQSSLPDGDKKDEAAERVSQALTWIEEIVEAEKIIEAPMHFTPSNMAETISLATIVLKETHQADYLVNLGRKYRWKAEQSFTMGRQYYQNLSRLHYLFDDFNDRRRHANHAAQMGMADILAFFRQRMDRR